MTLYVSRKPLNLLGLHTSIRQHTHRRALHMLIEWLLMALKVNLCLAGSSGCLRGHLIKGNETSRGLFQPTVTELHAHSFASLAQWKKVRTPSTVARPDKKALVLLNMLKRTCQCVNLVQFGGFISR